MARDRKRAKQRRDRRVRENAHAAPPQQPARADVPGALDHASGEVDEFDAALIRGADGTPAPPEELEAAAVPGEELEAAAVPGEELEPDSDDVLQEPGGPAGGGGARGGGGGDGRGDGGGERPSGAPLRGGNRVLGFLRASWAELQRVQWPDRRQVTQATAVVLGFVAIAGAYLGLADVVAKEIVELVIG